MAFVGAVLLAKRATSTGGTETLVQHQRSIEMKKVTDGGVVRISVGLEDVDDIVEDFERALWVAERVLEEGPERERANLDQKSEENNESEEKSTSEDDDNEIQFLE